MIDYEKLNLRDVDEKYIFTRLDYEYIKKTKYKMT